MPKRLALVATLGALTLGELTLASAQQPTPVNPNQQTGQGALTSEVPDEQPGQGPTFPHGQADQGPTFPHGRADHPTSSPGQGSQGTAGDQQPGAGAGGGIVGPAPGGTGPMSPEGELKSPPGAVNPDAPVSPAGQGGTPN